MKSGVITKKNVTVGAVVSPEQVLYEVQDLSKLWLDITLYSDSISKIKKNQLVTFVSDSFPDKKFFAKIDYIQPVSDDVSQTFIARAFIDNSLGLLKSGMFGKATIKSDVKIKKVFVPEGAVQKYGKENFVFLDLGDNKYKKVNVELGEKVEGGYFINSGIQVGDIIVTKGSFTLKAEMLKSEFEEED
jgi:RND family efflux transporter MFP subunit